MTGLAPDRVVVSGVEALCVASGWLGSTATWSRGCSGRDNIPVAHSGGQQRPLYSPATWEPESSDDGYTWDMQIPSKMSSLQQTSTSQSPLKKNLFPEISAVQSLSKMISQPVQQKLNP